MVSGGPHGNPFYMVRHNYYDPVLHGAPVLREGETGGSRVTHARNERSPLKKRRRERKPAINASKSRTFTGMIAVMYPRRCSTLVQSRPEPVHVSGIMSTTASFSPPSASLLLFFLFFSVTRHAFSSENRPFCFMVSTCAADRFNPLVRFFSGIL